jgi:hypothetical protein
MKLGCVIGGKRRKTTLASSEVRFFHPSGHFSYFIAIPFFVRLIQIRFTFYFILNIIIIISIIVISLAEYCISLTYIFDTF